MRSLLLAPHNDDEALFASYIIQIYNPLVVILTDSYIQFERGEKACSAQARIGETEAAMRILGANVEFLHIPDKDFNETLCTEALKQYQTEHFKFVFAPALEGGNWMHDVTAQVAAQMFPGTIHYSTYTKDREYPAGHTLVFPTDEMKAKKLEALKCYTSQWNNVCRQYFTAASKDEYFAD